LAQGDPGSRVRQTQSAEAMVRLISCALSMLVPVVASDFPLKPQWSATILGENGLNAGGGTIQGTFRWDSEGGGTPKVEANWKFDSWFSSQGLEDTMGFACSFSDESACTSSFRKACFRGLDKTRTESMVRLLLALHENGTHAGDCSAYTNATDTQLWHVQQAGIGNLSMCITSDGLPIGFESDPDKEYVGWSNVGVATFHFLFHNVTLGPQSITEAQCPTCVAAACSGEGIRSIEVIRLTRGGGEPWDQIWNLDAADFAGEIMFDNGFSRPYMKVFNVTVNTSWGPMRDCNFVNGENTISPPKDASLAKLVARGDAESFEWNESPCSGQCGKNELGSYYAFPKDGGCLKGSAIGTEGCSWQVNSVKVVSTECVKSAGQFIAAATKDYSGIKPWPDVQASIRRGITECPDIRSLRR